MKVVNQTNNKTAKIAERREPEHVTMAKIAKRTDAQSGDVVVITFASGFCASVTMMWNGEFWVGM
jgi:hypothetical protein